MMETLPVRRTDPDTSKRVAAAPGPRRNRPRVRDAVLAMLRGIGPMTHDQIIAHMEHAHGERPDVWPPASPSSVRTRVSELVRDGLVERVPDAAGKSTYGNAAILWRAVTVQGK